MSGPGFGFPRGGMGGPRGPPFGGPHGDSLLSCLCCPCMLISELVMGLYALVCCLPFGGWGGFGWGGFWGGPPGPFGGGPGPGPFGGGGPGPFGGGPNLSPFGGGPGPFGGGGGPGF